MSKAVRFLLIGVLLALGLGLAARVARHWAPRSDEPSAQEQDHEGDPRLWYATEFRNVRPDVKYVGMAACAECHADYAEAYSHHPMGRSLAPIAAVADQQNYSKEVGNPFDAVGFRFRIDRAGDRVFHQEMRLGEGERPVTETSAEIQYAIGSGTHAYSYLLERDGVLFQSPITWFTQKNRWDLSPGYKERRDRFERIVMPGCLFCHCDRADAVPHALNRYRKPTFHGEVIGCERCHGPGELHVQARGNGEAAGGVDTTIVNPRHLSPSLRDSVCEQCHLGGYVRIQRRGRDVFDYRPGLPFELFWRVFVKPGRSVEEIRVAGHAEQMHASRCFRASDGKLGCISCHDPHMLPRSEEKDGYYRARCLQCHESKGCSVAPDIRRRTTANDSCAVCHMPSASSDLDHIALTDHRIPRSPGSAADAASAVSALPLVSFYDRATDPHDQEMGRDLGCALMNLARQGSDPAREPLSRLVSPWLVDAVRAHPDDFDARDALAVALALQNRVDEALTTCEGTLQQAPQHEQALADAALVAGAMGRRDASLRYWRAALEMNPWSSRYRYETARLLAGRQEWDKVLPECQRVLKYNSAHVQTRLLLVEYYLRKGDKEQAQAEFKTVIALQPPNVEQLKQWFAGQAAR